MAVNASLRVWSSCRRVEVVSSSDHHKIYRAATADMAPLEFVAQQLWVYKNERSNMGIGGIIPVQKMKMAV